MDIKVLGCVNCIIMVMQEKILVHRRYVLIYLDMKSCDGYNFLPNAEKEIEKEK